MLNLMAVIDPEEMDLQPNSHGGDIENVPKMHNAIRNAFFGPLPLALF
jgi:hypothetical protein